MFTALFCGVGASALYRFALRLRRDRRNIYSENADLSYNNAVAVILPAVLVIFVFCAV